MTFKKGYITMHNRIAAEFAYLRRLEQQAQDELNQHWEEEDQRERDYYYEQEQYESNQHDEEEDEINPAIMYINRNN